jgi:hypothetical protein
MWKTAALLVALTIVSGCGAKSTAKEPVVFGSARPAGPKLSITVPRGGVVPAGKWPSACQFLTEDEIVALLPQATAIKRAPKKVSVLTILDKDQNQSAAEGECAYSFWLKGATIEDVRSSVSVGIAAVADPALVARHYAGQLKQDRTRTDRPGVEDQAGRLGPLACYSWLSAGVESHLICRQGPLMFEVTGIGFGRGVAAQQWRDRVQAPVARIVAGKVA